MSAGGMSRDELYHGLLDLCQAFRTQVKEIEDAAFITRAHKALGFIRPLRFQKLIRTIVETEEYLPRNLIGAILRRNKETPFVSSGADEYCEKCAAGAITLRRCFVSAEGRVIYSKDNGMCRCDCQHGRRLDNAIPAVWQVLTQRLEEDFGQRFSIIAGQVYFEGREPESPCRDCQEAHLFEQCSGCERVRSPEARGTQAVFVHRWQARWLGLQRGVLGLLDHMPEVGEQIEGVAVVAPTPVGAPVAPAPDADYEELPF